MTLFHSLFLCLTLEYKRIYPRVTPVLVLDGIPPLEKERIYGAGAGAGAGPSSAAAPSQGTVRAGVYVPSTRPLENIHNARPMNAGETNRAVADLVSIQLGLPVIQVRMLT